MPEYQAPKEEMTFVINEIAGMTNIMATNKYAEISPDVVDAILEEAGKFCSEVLSPLNQSGDVQGSKLENGIVRTPDGFKKAYKKFSQAGWNGMPFDEKYGGQNLPWLLTTAVGEMIQSANMSFGLCPLLTQGAIELLSKHGNEELKETYLNKMIAGEWPGTMNLTEPQAGTDLSQIRTKAVKDGEKYRVHGTKIYITYGDHDLAENIIHMVLARIQGGPEGNRGISLFVVPKFLVNKDGSLEAKNDLRVVSLEHKLGIKASPTAVMSYGDNYGAEAYIVGKENHGIEYMFTMMNNARLAVGLQGVAIAERAYQKARTFALERKQSKCIGSTSKEPVAIIEHPDVKRMLLSMKCQTEATRCLAYFVAANLDISECHNDKKIREEAKIIVDILTPVVKAWGSDTGIEVANTGIQIHGGMGFIEESGAPQLLRDARITSIYEGTNGIQANDLVFRKIIIDKGKGLKAIIKIMVNSLSKISSNQDPQFKKMKIKFEVALKALEDATKWILTSQKENPCEVAAGAVPYLRLLGLVCGGWLLIRGASLAAKKSNINKIDYSFFKKKLISAQFFCDHFIIQVKSLARTVTNGGKITDSVSSSDF